mgnify:CR=1 FL=1
MNYLKRIFEFYIFSNMHVALAGFCITKITLLKFGYSENLTPLFVAFSIVVSYNFIRLYEIKYDHLSWLKEWFVKHKLQLFFLSFIAILPLFARWGGVSSGFSYFFGGTSLLIMVGVVLDTLQQIETYQLNRQMDSLMEGTRVRGRREPNELSGF